MTRTSGRVRLARSDFRDSASPDHRRLCISEARAAVPDYLGTEVEARLETRWAEVLNDIYGHMSASYRHFSPEDFTLFAFSRLAARGDLAALHDAIRVGGASYLVAKSDSVRRLFRRLVPEAKEMISSGSPSPVGRSRSAPAHARGTGGMSGTGGAGHHNGGLERHATGAARSAAPFAEQEWPDAVLNDGDGGSVRSHDPGRERLFVLLLCVLSVVVLVLQLAATDASIASYPLTTPR